MKFEIFFSKNDINKTGKLIHALKYLINNPTITVLVHKLEHNSILRIEDDMLSINNSFSKYDYVNVDDFIYIVYLLKKTNFIIEIKNEEKFNIFKCKIHDRWFLSSCWKKYAIIHKNDIHVIPEKHYNMFFKNYKLISTTEYLRSIKLKQIL